MLKQKMFLLFIYHLAFSSLAYGMQQISEKYPFIVPIDPDITHVRNFIEIIGNYEILKKKAIDQEEFQSMKRAKCKRMRELVDRNYVYSMRKPIGEEKEYDCSAYVFATTIGFTLNSQAISLGVPKAGILRQCAFRKYFKRTNDPKKNDLVVYYTKEKHVKNIAHIGIFIDQDHVESKWGRKHIIVHKLFHVPFRYGNFVQYYTLKNKYRIIIKDPSLLIQDQKRHLNDFLINSIQNDVINNYFNVVRKKYNNLLKYYMKISLYKKGA